MPYTIETMTREWAVEISQWKYENEYSIYSFEQDAETIDELLNGDYFACTDRKGILTGYFCQGQSARIPTGDCYHYLDDKLDIGLGMRLTVERTVTHQISGASFGEDFWDC